MTEPITSFTGKWRFLSNFYPARVLLDGEEYPTVEHAFQAAKTQDPSMRDAIRWYATTPGEAKRRGRQLPLRPDWEQVKDQVMLELVRQKSMLPGLRTALLATGDAGLENNDPWGGQYWGIVGGQGQNRLGQILMQVRNELHRNTEGDRSWSR